MRSQIEPPTFTRQVFLRRASAATLALAVGGIVARPCAAAAGSTTDDVVRIRGTFTLGAGSNGIDPATQLVSLRLLVPPGDRVYPSETGVMPVTGFDPTADGWALSSAEKQRTGIQAFEINRTGEPGRFAFNFVDTRTDLAVRNYDAVRVDLRIGDDAGAAHETLVEQNGTWTLS
jgi:hypothetical protein